MLPLVNSLAPLSLSIVSNTTAVAVQRLAQVLLHLSEEVKESLEKYVMLGC